MTPTQIALAVAFAGGLSVGGASAWKWQASRVSAAQLELTHEKLGRANERITQQRAARETADRLAGQVIKAQNDAVARTRVIAADSQRARTELERLQHASADALRAASLSLDACIGAAHAYDLISTQCAAQLTDLARDADRHVSDITTLTQAWPKLNTAETPSVK